MKKLSVICAFCFVLSALAYTTEDVSNANYLADQKIVTKQTTATGYRLDDKILRQEVIGMALKVKGVTLPENYTCKKYFADATKNDWVCRAVELAADNGIITRSNKYANPGKSITRAEALAMMMPKNWEEFGVEFAIEGNEWQRTALSKYLGKVLDWDARTKSGVRTEEITDGIGARVYWRPNSLATRAEVFAFAKDILMSSTNSYEGFTADFGGNVDMSDGFYGFGEIGQALEGPEGSTAHNFYITVQPRKSAVIASYSPEPISLVQKYWDSNVYYTTMLSGMCYTGKLIFLTDEYVISASGSCNQTVKEVEDALKSISFHPNNTGAISAKDVLRQYYRFIKTDIDSAYDMRFPAGVSLETFKSWYKNTESVTFREDTLEDMDPPEYQKAHGYGFLVDMTENGIKSTYKVTSEVNLEDFTINNISSVKQ